MKNSDSILLTDSDFSRLQKYVRDKVGIDLRLTKKDKIFTTIEKRMKINHLFSIEDYLLNLKKNDKEEEVFINLITNFTTDFFRESHHFEFLKTKWIPEIIKKPSKHDIRIWSAGCASGEEPYSIAMTLLQNISDPSHYDIKILATDINTLALKMAKEGLYDQTRLENHELQKKWFDPEPDSNLLHYRIKPSVASLVNFKKLNLLDPWPMKKKFDIIFFRNVLIYMTEEATEVILKKFDHYLKKNGILIIGHSEAIPTYHPGYTLLGKSIYRKISDNEQD